nr:unnamed protein product [Digitaria exilis]
MSSSVSVAAEWDLLSDRFYRRLTLYSPLPWSAPAPTSTSSSSGGAVIGRLDLSTHIVAAAPFGGPIAAVRDDSKIVQLHSEPSRRRLLLFSSSGHPIASAPWPPLLPRLHSLAFSSSLSLLALLSDGSLLRFRLPDLQPTPSSSPVPLLPPASGGVADAVFWGGGVAILTEDNRVVVATDIEAADPHPRDLADPGVGDEEHVLCMAVVEPQFVMSGSPEVLLAVGDRVIAVDEDGVQVLGEELEIGPVQKMAVSPNGKLLAAFAHDGRLLVIPTDFSRIIFEYECDAYDNYQLISSSLPEAIEACIDAAGHEFDVSRQRTLLRAATYGLAFCSGSLKQKTLGRVCQEDNRSSNQAPQQPDIHAPEAGRPSAGTPASRGPGAGTPAAGEPASLPVTGGVLPAAVVATAGEQVAGAFPSLSSPLGGAGQQGGLPEASAVGGMKAAEAGWMADGGGGHWGGGAVAVGGRRRGGGSNRSTLAFDSIEPKASLGFGSRFPHERFQEMCKMLRVLNAVRDPEIGMPLTIQQYKLLTAPVLIGRLINANQHLLALRISEYLNLNPEVVIMHWACEKITASATLPDTVLLEGLLDKLRLCKGISYAAVAAHADSCGRRRLAAMLVDHESQSSKQARNLACLKYIISFISPSQIPLLLSIDEQDKALSKAIESGDTDLVYLVLFHIWQKLAVEKKAPLDFFGVINARSVARDLFMAYARHCKHEALKDFFLSTGRLQDVAFLLLKESRELEKNPMASKGSPLHGPQVRLIEQAHRLFAETKEHVFESKASEEHAKLLRSQHELEVSTKQAIFVGSSVSDTIKTCIVMGNERAALKVKSEFKVPEKRWYWLKTCALATVGNWDGLEKFSREKRPPGGYKPFVEACIDAGKKTEALKYIPKLTDPRERSEAYARMGMAKEAADAASQAKDSDELFGRLKITLAQNTAAASIFDTLRDRLSFQGAY